MDGLCIDSEAPQIEVSTCKISMSITVYIPEQICALLLHERCNQSLLEAHSRASTSPASDSLSRGIGLLLFAHSRRRRSSRRAARRGVRRGRLRLGRRRTTRSRSCWRCCRRSRRRRNVSWRWCAMASATPRWVSTTPTPSWGIPRRPTVARRWIFSRAGLSLVRPLRAAPGESLLSRPTLCATPPAVPRRCADCPPGSLAA